jgi:hypothetical protein
LDCKKTSGKLRAASMPVCGKGSPLIWKICVQERKRERENERKIDRKER